MLLPQGQNPQGSFLRRLAYRRIGYWLSSLDSGRFELLFGRPLRLIGL